MMRFPERYRVQMPPPFNSSERDPWGCFVLRAKDACGRPLKVMACSGLHSMSEEPAHRFMGWDHASVSLFHRSRECPTWEEMALVKELFWEPEDCVVQFHPPRSEYVNTHPGCLHLWRYVGGEMPRPHPQLV